MGSLKWWIHWFQNYGHILAIKNIVDSAYHDYFISMVSFTRRCTFKLDEELRKIASNELVVYDIELTEFINRKIAILKLQHKEPFLSDSEIVSLYGTLTKANITDTTIRKQHVENIKQTKNETDNTASKSNCVVCHKPVSDKVKSFCLSSPKFVGKVYCYEHQKNIK